MLKKQLQQLLIQQQLQNQYQRMNNQQVSQVLTFYRMNFHFHDPYKFLIDGNFIKLMIEKQIDFKRRLQNVINGKVKFYVPGCLIRQLQLLGPDFKLVYEKAKEFRKTSCKHDFQISVDQCIVNNIIGENNSQKYIVCSQDIELRRYLRHVLNCPLMYFGPDQRIKFEDVHKKNLQMVEQQIKQKLLPKPNQMGQINELKKQKIKQKQEQQKNHKLKLASEMGVKIKTKIARGPNPMAIRKKKINKNQSYQKVQQKQLEQQKEIVDEAKTKRIRKRNKNKNNHQQNTENIDRN